MNPPCRAGLRSPEAARAGPRGRLRASAAAGWTPALLAGLLAFLPAAGAAPDPFGDPLPEGAVQRLGTQRMRYAIADADYAADSRRAFVISGTELHVWDLERGEIEQRHVVSDHPLVTLALNSDRSRALVSDGRGALLVWDVREHALIRSFAGQAGAARYVSVDWSADESRALTLDAAAGCLEEWSVPEGRRLREIRLPDETTYYKAVYGPGGRSVFVARAPHPSVVHYRLEDGSILGEFLEDFRAPDILVSPDATRLLVGSRHMASEWDTRSHERLHQIGARIHSGYEVLRVGYAAGGSRAITGSRDGSLRLWNEDRTEVLRHWYPNRAAVRLIRVSPDQAWVLTYGSDGLLSETSLSTGERRLQWDRHFAGVEAVAVDPGTGRVATGSADGTIWVWSEAEGRALRRIEHPSGDVRALAIDRQGRLVAAGSRDGSIRVFGLDDGQEVAAMKEHFGFVRRLVYLEDGTLLSAADDGSLALWNPDRGRLLRRFGGGLGEGHFGGVLAAAVSGGVVLSGGRDGTVLVWSVKSGRLIDTFATHRGEVGALDSDGTRVVSGGSDGQVIVRELPGGRVIRRLDHGSEVRAVRYLAQRGLTVSAGADGVLKVWGPEGNEPIAGLQGHDDAVQDLAVSPDGRRAYSVSLDTTALIWDLESVR